MRLVYLCLQATRQGQASYAHVHEIIAGLEQRGWNVHLVEPSYTAQSQRPGGLRRLLELAWIQLKALPALARADVVYVRSHFAALPGSLWAAVWGRAIVQELNGTYDDMFVAWPQLWFARPILVGAQRVQLRIATAVITVTDGLAQWVRADAHPQTVAVIPNGANVELFTPDGPRWPDLPSKYAGFVGSLAGWHGVDVMLQAVSNRAWPADTSLVVVGDGPGAEDVRRAAAADDRIIAMGPLPYRDIPQVIRGAIVMLSVQPLMPTTTAGGINPLKVYEALACGAPIVVSDLRGQADLARAEHCGWVVPPGDPAAVARAVAEAVADPNRAKAAGARGRQAVVREHSWNARAGATHALLLQLVGKHRS